MKCISCGKTDDLWSLTYIGHYCSPCALNVLAYWAINAQPAIDKILASQFVPTPDANAGPEPWPENAQPAPEWLNQALNEGDGTYRP